MGVILDASVLIESERGRFDMPAFLEALGDARVAVAAITAAELLFGLERAADPAVRARRGAYVEGLLEAIPTVPFGLSEARRQATLWAALRRRGQVIGAYDMLVAATALANDCALATLNRAEFERVPGLSLVDIDPFRVA